MILEPGKVIGGKFVLEEPAGFGGMAEVWVATNSATGARVCVKVLARAGDEEEVERFRRGAHAAAKLSHRAIVRVFDLLSLDATGQITRREPADAYAIVMELLKGETLGELLARRGKLPREEALDLFLPVMSALAHAHRAWIVHRDLKPDNIFLAVDPDGHVAPKVLDFGISKMSNAEPLTSDGVIVGTPSFMSPEQAKGASFVDARSDVFSAGTLLYVMLSGVNPFEAKHFAEALDALIRREVPPLPDLPGPIWTVLERALKKDPQQRFGDATEMVIALRKAAGRRATTDSMPSLPAFDIAPAAPPPTTDDGSGAASKLESPASLAPPMHGTRRIFFAGVGAVVIVLVLAISSLLRGKAAPGDGAEEASQAGSAAPSVAASKTESLPPPTPIATATQEPLAPPPASAPPPPAVRRDRPGSAPPRKPRIVRDPGF
jgi:serine/threonine-protein kinase